MLLPSPSWPQPNPNQQFVHHFGRIKKRLDKGHDFFKDELYFASADGAIKLPALEKYLFKNLRVPTCYPRRLFNNGEGKIRVELCISYESDASTDNPLVDTDWLDFARHMLDLEIKVKKEKKAFRNSPLMKAGPALRSLFNLASSPRAEEEDIEKANKKLLRKLVKVCDPILFIEYNWEAEVPERANTIELKTESELKLATYTLQHKGQQLPIWFLGKPANSNSKTNREARNIRVAILHLYAAFEQIKSSLLSFRQNQKKVAFDPEIIEAFLNKSEQILEQRYSNSSTVSKIQKEILAFQDYISEEDIALLQQAIQKFKAELQISSPASSNETAIEAEDILDLISEDKLEEALEAIRQTYKAKGLTIPTAFYTIKGNYSTLVKQNLRGRIKMDDYLVGINTARDAIISLVEDL